MQSSDFPPHFAWGTATAAYQIEGGVSSDGRGTVFGIPFLISQGNCIKTKTGTLPVPTIIAGGKNALMRELGVNAYRFSIAWPRIIPLGHGAVNQPGLDFYDRLVDALLEAHITPFATLYHWDFPQPLQDAGGWVERSTIDAFLRYVEVVTQRLGDRVPYWLHTMNFDSKFSSPLLWRPCTRNPTITTGDAGDPSLIALAGYAIPIIRAANQAAQVGIALNFVHCEPVDDSPAAQDGTKRYDGQWNRWCLNHSCMERTHKICGSFWATQFPSCKRAIFRLSKLRLTS